MFVSVRECMLPSVFGDIRSGLDAMGIDAVELEYFRDRTVCDPEREGMVSIADDRAIDAFVTRCSQLGIRVSALLLHNNFGAADLDWELDWVISTVRAAARLGAKAIRIDAIMSTEQEWSLEKRIGIFADCMHRVIDATDGLDVNMGIENHGLQGNQPDFLDAVLNAVDSPRLGVNIDTANFYWAGFPLSTVHDIIEHFAPRAKHTHVKNINFPKDQREVQREIGWGYMEYVSPLRQGDIDIPWLISTLRRSGYNGDLCIENESLHRFDPAGQKAALIDDASYLKELLAQT